MDGITPAKTILVVDDEQDILTYLSTLLDDHGYTVRTASNAKEAWEKILSCAPDLLTLDIMMPKQSGIAFYRNMKLDARTQTIPVIFISAFSMAQNFTGFRFRKLVPDEEVPEPEGFLEKPIVIPTLLALIRNVIG